MQKVEKLIEDLERLKRREHEEKGKMKAAKRELKETFGITPDKIKTTKKKLKIEIAKLESSIKRQVLQFQKEWKRQMPNEDCPI